MRVLYKVGILSKPRTVQTPLQTQHRTSWPAFPRTDHYLDHVIDIVEYLCIFSLASVRGCTYADGALSSSLFASS